jgi:hypothetical protein
LPKVNSIFKIYAIALPAVPSHVAEDLFEEPVGKLLLKNHRLKLISFDPKQEVIKQWITPT